MPPDSLLDNFRAEGRAAADRACHHLAESLASLGVALPGLRVERTETGQYRLALGSMEVDAAEETAFAVFAGASVLNALRDDNPDREAVWLPEVGELLVDSAADRLGEFVEVAPEGRWLLAPIGGGEPWAVDRSGIGFPTRSHMARAGAARRTARTERLRAAG
ncbi:hypothetical protein [Kitasatospora cineracea]|uniref:hypothetical protein n=1 Tax=Kitasatospora cineracea TaxID=88074 RepID=UPI00380C0FA0